MASDTKNEGSSNFKPKILAFVCNWCAYGASESAGVTGHEYPTTIKIIKVLCSSRVDRAMILKAIQDGVDGIIVVACNIGNCHYMSGNSFAKERIEATTSLLGNIGVDEKRIKFQEMRASEGNKLAQILTEFSENIKNLGPNK